MLEQRAANIKENLVKSVEHSGVHDDNQEEREKVAADEEGGLEHNVAGPLLVENTLELKIQNILTHQGSRSDTHQTVIELMMATSNYWP